MDIEDALAGKHGPEAQEKAEGAVRAAVSQLADMFKGEIRRGALSQGFASGGVIKAGCFGRAYAGPRFADAGPEMVIRRPTPPA